MLDEYPVVAEDMQRGYEARVQTHVTFGCYESTLALYHARLGDISVLRFAEDKAVRRELAV